VQIRRARRERLSCDGAEDRYEVAPIHAKHVGHFLPDGPSAPLTGLCPVLPHCAAYRRAGSK